MIAQRMSHTLPRHFAPEAPLDVAAVESQARRLQAAFLWDGLARLWASLRAEFDGGRGSAISH